MALQVGVGYNISGRLLLDPWSDAGARTGFLPPINCTMFQVDQPEPTEDLLIDNREGNEGKVIGARYIQKPAAIKIKLSTFPPEILAALFMGAKATLSATSGTVTDEAVTLIPNRGVRLSKREIAQAGFAIATAEATPVAVPIGDLMVDYEHGIVTYIGTTITAPQACTADFSYGDLSGYAIGGQAKSVVDFSALIVGKNTKNNKRIELDIPELKLSSRGLDLMSGKWIDAELGGRIVVPEAGGDPYTFREW